MTSWRYLADDGVTASFGLAADEALAARQTAGASPPTVRLYTYRSHCALVGRFQRVASEVRLDACRARGIAVNRRPTGGGAILMGGDQLGVAIAVPGRGRDRSWDRVRELFLRFAAGLVDALARLGIAAEYRRKNDLEVGGRKIAGLGLCFDRAGGLLFHASLLVDLDVPLMLSVLRTPFAKISDKEIATVAERVTTVRRERGRARCGTSSARATHARSASASSPGRSPTTNTRRSRGSSANGTRPRPGSSASPRSRTRPGRPA